MTNGVGAGDQGSRDPGCSPGSGASAWRKGPRPAQDPVISKEAPHRFRGRRIAWRRLRNLLSATGRHAAALDSVGLPSVAACRQSGLSVSVNRFLGRAKVQCVGKLPAALPRNDNPDRQAACSSTSPSSFGGGGRGLRARRGRAPRAASSETDPVERLVGADARGGVHGGAADGRRVLSAAGRPAPGGGRMRGGGDRMSARMPSTSTRSPAMAASSPHR
jgi:hypothetical protein